MDMSNPKVQEYTKDQNSLFEMYLEGILIPFTSIELTESENTYPTAIVTLPATSGALRLLAGTIIQVFGPGLIEDATETKTLDKVLLFEGELKAYAYHKHSFGRIVTLECESLLNHFERAKILPVDSILTTELTAALNINKVSIYNNKTILPDHLSTSEELKAHVASLGNWSGDMADISLKTTLGGLATELLKLLQKPSAKKGDYLDLFHKVEAYFELYDILYGAKASAFKIRASLLAMPNKEHKNLQTGFRSKLAEASFKNFQKTYNSFKLGETDQITLKTIFDSLLNILNYKLIRPASYPYATRFYTNSDNKGPIRGILAPNLDLSPPALCNVFFPDQVQTFQFARDLKNEVTRVIAQAPAGYIENSVFKMFFPIYITPGIALGTSGAGGYQTGFTIEESYRGVVPKYVTLDHTFYSALKYDMDEVKNKERETTGEEVTPDTFNSAGMLEGLGIKEEHLHPDRGSLGAIFKELSANEYFKSKLQNRNFTLACEWSPYRMVGIPALMIDKNGPSVVGTITAITTIIQSTGVASSNVFFKNARLIFDNEMDSPFLVPPGSIEETETTAYLLKDFVSENYMNADSLLYDEEMYGAYNIGLDAYSYMIFGKGHKDKKLEAFGATIDDENNTCWKQVNLLNKNLTQRRDQSIFSLIRANDTDRGISGLYIDPKWKKYLSTIDEPHHSAILYGIQFYSAVHALRKQYTDLTTFKTSQGNKTQIPKTLQAYVTNMIWRPIISKTQYLNDLGVSNLGDLEDYKDTKVLFGAADSITKILDEVKQADLIPKSPHAGSIKYLEKELVKWLSILSYIDTQKVKWAAALAKRVIPITLTKDEKIQQQLKLGNFTTSHIIAIKMQILGTTVSNLRKTVQLALKQFPKLLLKNTKIMADTKTYNDALILLTPFHQIFTAGIDFRDNTVFSVEGYNIPLNELRKFKGIKDLEERIKKLKDVQLTTKTPAEKLESAKALTAIFKPYALIRRAHVLEGMHAFRVQANKKTMVTT